MKVLLCNTTDIGGGAAKAVLSLLKGLTANNINTRMLVLNKETINPLVLEVGEILEDKSLERFYGKLKRKLNYYYTNYRWHQYPNRQNIALDDIFISYLENTLDLIDFDILNLHWIEGGFINFTELSHLNKPIIWTLHGSFPFTGICHHLLCDKYKSHCGSCPALGSKKEKDFSNVNFELKKKRYKNLNLHIVSPSQYLANHAMQSTLLGEFPIHVIPNGIDIQVFYPKDKNKVRETLNINNKRSILFGAIAAISDKNKGFKTLLESLKILNNVYHQDIQFIMFGEKFNDENSYEFNMVNFGHINDDNLMCQLYSAADVMVVPSKHENLSYTIMESLACATPVVAFNVGGNSEMIDHKQNGYLAEPFNPNDLADGITWCLENNKYGMLSNNARNKVLKNFKLEIIVKQYIDLYQSILEN
jgi:glycosyltransferase involved in cell wall biosynthesis